MVYKSKNILGKQNIIAKKKMKKMFALLLAVSIFVNPLLSEVDVMAYADEKIGISENNEATVGNESLVVTDNKQLDEFVIDYEQLELQELVTKEDIDKGKHIKRMYEEEESLSQAVYLNEDGTRTAYHFMHPIKYKDSKGKVKDISLELKEDSKGNFISVQSDVIATFPKNLKEGISLEKSEDDILITMHLTDNQNEKALVLKEKVRTKANEDLVQYTYDEDTSVEYQLTYTGIKENIIVEKYTGQTEYSFIINTNGLKLIEDERTLLLVDEENSVKSVVGDVIIYTEDNVNNTFGELSYKTVKEKETYLVTIHVDEEFLSDPKTKYPIVIDPTIEINSSSSADAISDVTINSAAGSSGSSVYLYAGNRSSVGISRILMKFPGLNLSSIGASDRIVTAYLNIKDVVQTQESVQVQCYVFGGNTWEEDTATWSNTSPNTITTHLANNTISYEMGERRNPRHTYIYDITKAVKGWRVGNMNINKGVIFKIPNDLEQGTTDVVKAFASYERSDGKPYLVITYNTTGSLPIAEGSIYLNNWQSGKYLSCSENGIKTQSGLINTCGSRIRWMLRKVDGGYVIRSSFSSSTYLAVPVDMDSGNVEGVSIIDKTIPDRCIWEISIVESGKITIKNKYNGKYLFDNGTYLNTSDVLDTAGDTVYRKRVWRYASVSQYGSSSASVKPELSSFSVATCTLFSGETIVPNILLEPNDAYWAEPEDFTYTGIDASRVSYNSLTGKFTALTNFSSMYKQQVTATHKVTGMTATFDIVVNPKAQLIGVVPDSSEENMYTWINTVHPIVERIGYSEAVGNYGSYTLNAMKSYLNNNENGLFVIKCHGILNGSDEPGLIINYASNSTDPNQRFNIEIHGNDFNDINLQNMKLCIFAACRSGYGGEGYNNLPNAAVNAGAETAIGFKNRIAGDPIIFDSIIDNKTDTWLEHFFLWMEQGKTVEEACETLKMYFQRPLDDTLYDSYGFEEYYIAGNKELTF